MCASQWRDVQGKDVSGQRGLDFALDLSTWYPELGKHAVELLDKTVKKFSQEQGKTWEVRSD